MNFYIDIYLFTNYRWFMATTAIRLKKQCADGCATADTPASVKDLSRHVQVFKALADETRLKILERLASVGSAQCACHIEAWFDLSQPTVSHHLKVLRDAGLITSERRGTWIFYALDKKALAAMPGLFGVLAQ